MQSPGFGEWQEPFSKSQVGSSAMPFKKNPVKSEQICSLARLVVSLSRVTWDNASSMLLERTLDDSANRRIVNPEMFLATDEILVSAAKIVNDLTINDKRITKNLEAHWPFSVTESVIIEAVKNGANRQEMHEVLREIAMKAWEQIQEGKSNPMADLLESNEAISKYIKPSEIDQLMDFNLHLGNAPQKCREILEKINNV